MQKGKKKEKNTEELIVESGKLKHQREEIT